MSEKSGEDMNVESIDSSDSQSVSSYEETVCQKLSLAENLLAYLEKRELVRDTEHIECDNSLKENVMSNYVIVKQIISHLSWQDKIICKSVCTMWNSVVQALEKEQQSPEDFALAIPITALKNGVSFKKSGEFLTKPIAVLTFSNMLGFIVTSKCEVIEPNQCTPSCEYDHYLIDVVQQNIVAPKDCMLTIRASYLSYMPLPSSATYEHMLTQQMFIRSNPFISGVVIPAIPDVEFKVINLKSLADMQKDFYDIIDGIAQTHIFKGVLVYVTESYLLHSVEDIVFLNYFKDVQPSVPYALGGCIVEDTMSDSSNINIIVNNTNSGKDFVSENLITIGLFTVPKNTNGCNFDMYSLILESSDWTKAKIEKTINEFAKRVPHFEHSVALKLSCVGRDQKHEIEQDYFRAVFPRTRLIGCYGNGELGINHPVKPPTVNTNLIKRHKRDPGPQFGIMYSYSSVFVYIGWGKVLSSPEFV